jgi:hypothetical protein
VVTKGKVKVIQEGIDRFMSADEKLTFCPTLFTQTDPFLEGQREVREALILVSRGTDLSRAARMLSNYLSQHRGGVFEQEALFHLCLTRIRLGQRDRAEELAHTFIRRFPHNERSRRLGELFRKPDSN